MPINDMTINGRQIAEWNGAAGDSWTIHQDRFDRMLSAYNAALLDAVRIKRHETMLDIGCGAGATAFELARRGARVTGVDVSDTLLNRARYLEATHMLGVDFIKADASLYDFPQIYDVLVSRLGVMFFDDPAAAFANLRKALKPGGRLAFLTWRGVDANDAALLPRIAAPPDIVPSPIDPARPGPFSFSDRDRIDSYLTQAGFRDIAITPFDSPLVFGEGETGAEALDDAVEMSFHIGPMRRLLDDQSELVRSGVCQRLRKLLSCHVTHADGPKQVVLKAGAWIITAAS